MYTQSVGRSLDITGRVFGKLTALSLVGEEEWFQRCETFTSYRRRWRCRCECGREVEALQESLTRGGRKYCDRRLHAADWQAADMALPRHAHRATWSSWSAMVSRCKYISGRSWKDYGGRGITVCDRWRVFENFLADMGERPAGTSIDRIDSNGNYEPRNCRWATQKQQINNRRNTVFVDTAEGRRHRSEVRREPASGLDRFGCLAVVNDAPHRKRIWRCLCDCGIVVLVPFEALASGARADCARPDHRRRLTAPAAA